MIDRPPKNKTGEPKTWIPRFKKLVTRLELAAG
jgi:hypothetical protein